MIGSLFSGYGGLDMAVRSVLGGDVAWHCEIEPAPSRILAHHYPGVPNLGDITKVDWDAVEPVDVLTGGFPCQDLSHAGKRAGLRPGTRSGLWEHMAYAIGRLRPGLVVIENVRGLLSAPAGRSPDAAPIEPDAFEMEFGYAPMVGNVGPGDGDLGQVEPAGPVLLRAMGAVLGDLAGLGYDARWAGVRASDAGAPHGRFRVFVVAWDAQVRGRDEAWSPQWRRESARATGGSGVAAADADSDGFGGLEELHGLPGTGRSSRVDRDDADGLAVAARGPRRSEVAWGAYEPAVRCWERVLGRPAPNPTETGAKGQPRLSPAFVEWMMGLPAGWVTQVPGLSRNDQLKALGNGVVPQQAELALRLLGVSSCPDRLASNAER